MNQDLPTQIQIHHHLELEAIGLWILQTAFPLPQVDNPKHQHFCNYWEALKTVCQQAFNTAPVALSPTNTKPSWSDVVNKKQTITFTPPSHLTLEQLDVMAGLVLIIHSIKCCNIYNPHLMFSLEPMEQLVNDIQSLHSIVCYKLNKQSFTTHKKLMGYIHTDDIALIEAEMSVLLSEMLHEAPDGSMMSLCLQLIISNPTSRAYQLFWHQQVNDQQQSNQIPDTSSNNSTLTLSTKDKVVQVVLKNRRHKNPKHSHSASKIVLCAPRKH